MTDETLPSWAAGFFEGEGTVTITRSGRRGYTRPLVCLTSTDREVIDLFQARWPGVVRTYQPKGNARIAHVWTLNVRPTIRAFLVELLPHLRTQRVQAKARLVIEDVDARVQGSRDPGYMVACHARREAVAALNKRGSRVPG
jgi:hypothetical protein